MKNLRELVLRYALQNAVFYNGKASPGAVLGKVVSDSPELRKKIDEVRKEIEAVIKEVNSLGPEKQKEMLKKAHPEMLQREEKKQEELPALPGAKQGGFATRFAPSPTGPLNLGHLLRPVMLPYLYAKKYGGIFILRFEDTDAKKIKKEYYGMIMEDLMSTGVKWDKLVKESDHMDIFYRHAEEMLKSGRAYVCTCPAEDFKNLKEKKKDCPCRAKSAAANVKDWGNMLKGSHKEGGAVVRLKTSMSDPNPTIRDPPLLRVETAPHPIKGTRYKVWPLYNFANVVEDHYSGITHVFRGKEHEHNTAIQKIIYDFFGWKMPEVVNFGMVYLPGTKLHTRDMVEMIRNGEARGWDDPKLPTVRALLRRGFQPDALRKFATVCSISKTDIRVGWENMEGINRKLIDSLSNRYMVVADPVRISVKGAPPVREAKEDLHPDFPARGKKTMPVDLDEIYLSKEDFSSFRGKTIRLKGLGNIRLDKISHYENNEIVAGMPKMQWVSKPNMKVEILTPAGKLSGLGEINMKNLKIGALVQMERIGFGRIDDITPKKITVCFAHK